MTDTQEIQQNLRRLAGELRLASQSLDRAGAFEDDSVTFEEGSILDVVEELLEMANDLWIENNLQELERGWAVDLARRNSSCGGTLAGTVQGQ